MSSSRITRKRGQAPFLCRRESPRHEKKLSGDPSLLGAGYAAFAGWGPFRGPVGCPLRCALARDQVHLHGGDSVVSTEHSAYTATWLVGLRNILSTRNIPRVRRRGWLGWEGIFRRHGGVLQSRVDAWCTDAIVLGVCHEVKHLVEDADDGLAEGVGDVEVEGGRQVQEGVPRVQHHHDHIRALQHTPQLPPHLQPSQSATV
eukprot:1180358-Prorocentrum_minimum.AAC.11